MARSLQQVQDAVAAALMELPGVFSTIQWGGRAYKLPGPGGNRKKPKLVAHVCMNKAGDRVCVEFKLEPDRARKVIDQHEWIKPHSFRTLAPSGWVSAQVRTMAQVKTLRPLLAKSRALHGETEMAAIVEEKGSSLDHVMRAVAAMGWKPHHDEEFDDADRRVKRKPPGVRNRKRP